MNDQLRGLGTALITPFKNNKSIDYEALDRLIDRQIAEGVDYIVVLGTTGEAATLTETEKSEIQQHVAQYVCHRVPLVLGMGGNNTAQLTDRIRKTDLSSYAALLSVCPFYNKPSQEGLYQHFCAVAEASPIPVILYNVPGRTGVNLLPETVMRIYAAQPDKIAGVKEASGNVAQIKELIRLAKDKLWVISGDDGITSELMEAGAAGLISVAANAFTSDFRKIVYNTGNEGAALQQRYAELVRLLFVEGNPAGIKTVLAQMGISQNELRLPLVSNSEQVRQEIREAMESLQ